VASAFQRQAAEGAVVHLTGVVGVTNRITIRPMQTSVDVRRLLTAALHRHARVEADNIQTWFADGKVTLHGKIRSWAERDAVEAAAWSAPGVADVENLIEVRT
jgi:osmotically-inducible protein OsmY